MSEKTYEILIPARELEFLSQLSSPDESIAPLLSRFAGAPRRGATVRLSRAEAERLRDFLTGRLASVGFDTSYRPNEEGEMLEELIDRFYIP